MTKRQNGVTRFWYSNTGQDLRRNLSQFCGKFLYIPRNMEEQICQGEKNPRHGKYEQGSYKSEMTLYALPKENSNYYLIN